MLPWAVLLMVGIVVWDTFFRPEKVMQWPEGERTYAAVVIAEPVAKPKTVAVDLLLLTKDRQKVRAYIHQDSASATLAVGDGLVFRSHIEDVSDFRHGRFDYRRHMETHGFAGTVYVPARKWQKRQLSLQRLSLTERCRLYFMKLRHRLLLRYRDAGIEGDDYSVIAAMTLGDKSALTPELRETYSVTGASHVLALSGLHLTIVYSLVSIVLEGVFLRAATQLLTVCCIWAFAFLVGLPPSVVRAATMLSLYALLSLGGRQKMSLNVLAVTAIAMLIVSPRSLFDVGFQLSFLAVLGILLWMPIADGLVSGKYLQEHPVVKWLWGLVAVSMAAQMSVAPLVAYYFGRFPTWFLLTNLVAIPAATVILYVTPLALAMPQVGAPLLVGATRLLNTSLDVLARLPMASIDNLQPTAPLVALTYALIFALNLFLRQKAPLRR